MFSPSLFAVAGGESCLPGPIVAAGIVLAIVDAAIAVVAFVQLLRIHLCSQHLGWTRQKIFHLLIGTSNIGYLIFLVSSISATCLCWSCWTRGCGFVLMASPQILFLAAFLLLLSFWVDLCHQANDEEEEDDEHGHNEALLLRLKNTPGSLAVDSRRKCCGFRNVRIGNRQKFVLLVIALAFVFTIAFALLIWIGREKNSINSPLVARVYLDIFSAAILLLGGALASYGLLLFSKMSKVRSEMASAETWKVASLAAVSLVCFTSSAVLVIVTNAPLKVIFYRNSAHSNHISSSIFIFLYYFVGSSVPSGFVLWVMRQMPPRPVDRPAQTRVTFVRERTPAAQNPQWRTAVASSQNKALKASPI